MPSRSAALRYTPLLPPLGSVPPALQTTVELTEPGVRWSGCHSIPPVPDIARPPSAGIRQQGTAGAAPPSPPAKSVNVLPCAGSWPHQSNDSHSTAVATIPDRAQLLQ